MKPIISKNIRVRYPEYFKVGNHSVIDDFCYFSTRVEVGVFSHIASSCSIMGGKKFCFSLGDHSSLASGVKILCNSNDFVNELVMIAPENLAGFPTFPITGDVVMERGTGVGCNSVVMPGNVIPEGTVIGALSFVPAKSRLEPWSVYAGCPVRRVGDRNRHQVMMQIQKIQEVQQEH